MGPPLPCLDRPLILIAGLGDGVLPKVFLVEVYVSAGRLLRHKLFLSDEAASLLKQLKLTLVACGVLSSFFLKWFFLFVGHARPDLA